MNKQYDYIVIGAGVSGCCIAYELSKISNNILLIDKLSDVASGASGAAGAFLSPLLGKPNDFKDLVTKSLKYSTEFYTNNFKEHIHSCGTTRIPKDKIDSEKFDEYIPYMDFEYSKDNDGYFFEIGSVVDSFNMCKAMTKDIHTKFDYEINNIKYENESWILNDEIQTKNIVVTTGIQMNLLNEFYLNIRPVWGRRIDVETSTRVEHNYHKACSVSKSTTTFKEDTYLVSIGATHHRDEKEIDNTEADYENLLSKASDIIELENINIVNEYVGARACSVDYFPMVGEVIDSKKTVEEFPYLKNGTQVDANRFTRYKNLYMINGVGGRGFVLAPYLAKQLINHIIKDERIDENLCVDRLFKREVRKIKK